MPQTLIRRYL